MLNDAKPRFSKCLRFLCGPIVRAIIDENSFEVLVCACLFDCRDQMRDIVSFVLHWNDDGEVWPALRHMPAARFFYALALRGRLQEGKRKVTQVSDISEKRTLDAGIWLQGVGMAGLIRPFAATQELFARSAASSSTSLNLIDSPQPQASATLGLRNLKPLSRSEVS